MEAENHVLEYFQGQSFRARMYHLSAGDALKEAHELRDQGYIVRVLDNTGREVLAPEKVGHRGR